MLAQQDHQAQEVWTTILNRGTTPTMEVDFDGLHNRITGVGRVYKDLGHRG